MEGEKFLLKFYLNWFISNRCGA